MTPRTPHARSGRILIQMAVIIFVGILIGAADAFVFRPIDLKPRQAPPDPREAMKGMKPRTGAGGAHTAEPGPRSTQPEIIPGPIVDPSPDQIKANTPAPKADPNFKFTPKEALPPGQITIDDGKALYDAGAIFVDSRHKEPYEQGHVLNALRIDTSMFQKGDPPELGLIPRDSVVVVYCNGGNCDESENLAKLLTNSGYKTVYVLHDGFPGWKAAGHPTATGE